MNFDELSKEQQIMVSMRKVLTNIIREITPAAGQEYPLTEQTFNDVRMCLTLITAREQELDTTNKARPHYVDELKTTAPLHHIKKKNS
ncbi:segregation and condensation protein A [Candidatus Halobeggiatoa sp. HSG11]|nr:segregation and condensation protein A [Candidatus Halobeggiatoa sp. HSG11]